MMRETRFLSDDDTEVIADTKKFHFIEWLITVLQGKREVFHVQVIVESNVEKVHKLVAHVEDWCKKHDEPRPAYSTRRATYVRSRQQFYIVKFHCYTETEAVTLKMFLDGLKD